MTATLPPSVASVARKLQTFLASDGATTGLRAELRRVQPAAPSLGALACVMSMCGEHAGQAELERWLSVARAFSLADPKRHQGDVPLGSALCSAGLSELRLERLLGAPDSLLDEMVWRICRMLQTKGECFNFVELAQLLLWRTGDKAADLRFRIASNYLRESGAASVPMAAAPSAVPATAPAAQAPTSAVAVPAPATTAPAAIPA